MSDPKGSARVVSPLDRAHAVRLAGRPEDALRLAASMLSAASEDIGAALLTAHLLADAKRGEPAASAARELVQRYVRRGDLPVALLAAHVLARAGGSIRPALKTIADAFGRGSPRVSAGGSLAPPPLPVERDVTPFFAELSGEPLLDAAAKVLSRALAVPDAERSDRSLPQLPLFGALAPAVLEQLLGAFALREIAAGARVVVQGSEGVEAYLLARGLLSVVREREEGSSALATLGPGALFGEMALVSQAPRAASVTALTPAHVFAASRSTLEALTAREPAIGRALGTFCHHRMVSNLMRHSAILSAVQPSQRSELVTRFTSRTFAPGQVLVQQGEEGGRLYLLASGVVEVRGRDAEGDPVTLAQLSAGDVVGEISLVLRRPATADVVALYTTVALELSREQFHEAIQEHPTLLAELYEIATRREDETRSVVAQEALDVSDVVLL